MRALTIQLVGESVEDVGDAVVYSLGLSEGPDGSEGFAVIFSLTEPDGEGAGVCVVIEPGQWTAYEAVVSSELVGRTLTLRLTEAGAQQLGGSGVLSLVLDAGTEAVATLERGFGRLGIPLVKDPT